MFKNSFLSSSTRENNVVSLHMQPLSSNFNINILHQKQEYEFYFEFSLSSSSSPLLPFQSSRALEESGQLLYTNQKGQTMIAKTKWTTNQVKAKSWQNEHYLLLVLQLVLTCNLNWPILHLNQNNSTHYRQRFGPNKRDSRLKFHMKRNIQALLLISLSFFFTRRPGKNQKRIRTGRKQATVITKQA